MNPVNPPVTVTETGQVTNTLVGTGVWSGVWDCAGGDVKEDVGVFDCNDRNETGLKDEDDEET